MRIRRYLAAAAAALAIGFIGVLTYVLLFTSGYGPQLGDQVPFFGHKQTTSVATTASQPTGSKGSKPGAAAGTSTPELPSDVLFLIGLVPAGAALIVLDRRRVFAERD